MFSLQIEKLKAYWRFLTGDSDKISLEGRIFHSFSIFILLTISLATVHNFVLHLTESGFITLLIVIIQAFLYYLSRVKGQFRTAVLLSAIEINLLTAVKYFFNAGVAGPTLLTAAVSLYLIILVMPKRQLWFWVGVNIVMVFTVTGIEYTHPEMVTYYNSRQDAVVDNLVGYTIVIFMLYMCTVIVRKSYDGQKLAAEEKAMNLQLLHAEKDKLFSIISHDLNAPLNMAEQYLKALTELPMDLPEREKVERDLLKNIINSRELLGNLLKWSRQQMDNTAVAPETVSVKDQLLKTAELFESIAAKKNISLVTAIEDDLFLYTDAEMLQLVIRNLLNNAVKFTRPEGRIELCATAQNDACLITVKDNGIGIKPERQRDIFSLKGGTTYGTDNEKGVGLGLVLCRDYTEMQGGKIWFNSVPNEGTCFYVSLPLQLNKVSELGYSPKIA